MLGKLHVIGNIQFRIYAGDHRPAHFHVVHPDYEAQIDILSLTVLRGSPPGRDRRIITEWAIANQARLIETWNQLNPTLAL